MPLLQAYTMNLECVSMFYVIFAEATGVSSISSKIGSLNKKNQKKKKKPRLLWRIHETEAKTFQ